jgi:hypothetical protein
MNIIHPNKLFLFITLFFASLLLTKAQDKPSIEKKYALSATIGSGLIYNIQNRDPFFDNLFYSPSLRIMWKPDHLLNIGLESGYLTISKLDSMIVSTPFDSTTFKARLNAIPMLLVFNMKVSKIDLYYGMGLSYLTTHLEAFDEKVIVGNWYYCYNIALAYNYPISKKMEIGIEAKSFFFPKLQTIAGGIAINFSYRFLQW